MWQPGLLQTGRKAPVTETQQPSYRVVFEPLGEPANCAGDETLLTCARAIGIRLLGACNGQGTCRSCLVKVLEGEVTDGDGQEWQRACRIKPRSNLVVELSPRSLSTPERTDVAGLDFSVPVEAAVRAVEVAMSAPTIEDCRADTERLAEALRARGVKLGVVPMETLLELPEALRRQCWKGTAVLRDGGELVAFRPPGSPVLGLAIDLGTTNVAAYLMDLRSGQRLASAGLENLQSAYGADVVTRITHAVRNKNGRSELAQAARTTLKMLIAVLCEEAGVAPAEIADVVACGNTAMHHLLLGLPVAQLGAVPFVAASTDPLEVRARDLGLPVAPGAHAAFFPGIGGYVGGDHTATLLATQGLHTGGVSIIMDIGTNTEISLLRETAILTVSCPSGPALEGGQITCGMRAARGAVERVRENGRGGFVCKTIENAEPAGLCGSGVLDAAAAMLRSGAIDATGRIAAHHPAVTQWQGRRAILLAEPNVVFTGHDVRSVQLAKAAIRSGIDILLAAAGLTEGRIDRVIVAGAFGAYINIKSAVAIGLLPPLPLRRFHQVGNAAGLGARLALLSRSKRAEAIALGRRCRYLELASQPGFQSAFMRRIGFQENVKPHASKGRRHPQSPPSLA